MPNSTTVPDGKTYNDAISVYDRESLSRTVAPEPL